MHYQLKIRVLDNELELNEDFAVKNSRSCVKHEKHVIEVAGHTGPLINSARPG